MNKKIEKKIIKKGIVKINTAKYLDKKYRCRVCTRLSLIPVGFKFELICSPKCYATKNENKCWECKTNLVASMELKLQKVKNKDRDEKTLLLQKYFCTICIDEKIANYYDFRDVFEWSFVCKMSKRYKNRVRKYFEKIRIIKANESLEKTKQEKIEWEANKEERETEEKRQNELIKTDKKNAFYLAQIHYFKDKLYKNSKCNNCGNSYSPGFGVVDFDSVDHVYPNPDYYCDCSCMTKASL